jgi:Zn ribbon nucleic-acid-binding protein
MSTRVSNWSEVTRRNWIAEAICPGCGETNLKGRKPAVELEENGMAYCSQCGHPWIATPPVVSPINPED